MNFFKSLSLFRLSNSAGVRQHRFQIPGEFVPCNPSLVVDGDGYLALVRTLNYYIDASGRYRDVAGSTSINWLIRLDRAFRVVDASVIDDTEARRGEPVVRYGLQDGRLFDWQGSWWFAASAKLSRAPRHYVFALCRLEKNRVAECVFVPSPLRQMIEKNWMPRVMNGDLKFVYRVSPTQIVHCGADGSFDFQVLPELAVEFAGWSGSSPIVRYGERWLCVAHLRVREKRPNYYLNAFIEFDDDFHILRFSKPWVFHAPTIEFCSGLCVDGEDAILGYGIWDREARLIRVPLQTVEWLLDRKDGGIVQTMMGFFRNLKPPSSHDVATITVESRPSGA